MATFTKFMLTGSTEGQGIDLVTSATPGTTLHTATNVASEMDEVWLYANNRTASQIDVTLEWGGTASGTLNFVGIPAQQGMVLITPGLTISGGNVVAAFASAVSGVSVFGFVNRINQA